MPTEPDGGRTLFPGHRVVAFYGEADAPTLGVLGDAPPGALWSRLASQAAAYDEPGTPVIPAYELIAYTAQASPGPDGNFTAKVSNSVIAAYLRVVRAHHGLLILDIQPGRSSFLADAETLSHWLAQPDVALALDPEWELQAGEIPLRQIGHTTASEINAVSSWLEDLVREDHLPQKLLIVHEFDASMIENKPDVRSRPDLAFVFNMDGFGSRPDKLAAYRVLAVDHRFYLGFKLFFDRDVDIFSAAEVLRLHPVPVVIEYE